MPLKVNLGLIEYAEVISIGEPGSRTFNISAFSDYGTGIVWIEKELLFDIADSLGRALEILQQVTDADGDEGSDLADDEIEPSADETGTVEFKAWRIQMHYDERRRLFHMAADGPDPDADEQEAFESPHDHEVSFYFSHDTARVLAESGMHVVQAGRPLCPHCAIPINQGEEHLCQRRNGYHRDEAQAVVNAIEDQ